MKYVITDNRIDENCEISLRQRGLEIIKLPCFPVLQEPVSAHPDMLLFLGEGRIVCHKDYFALAEKEISKISEITKKEIILSCENIGLEYVSLITPSNSPSLLSIRCMASLTCSLLSP